jgi:hypothetical protein
MISQNLVDKAGLGGGEMGHGAPKRSVFRNSGNQARRGYARKAGESEVKWQNHIVVALWISIALLIMLAGVLMYGETHGFFDRFTDHTAPLQPWTIDVP